MFWARQPPVRAVLLLITVPFWTVLVNTARVVLVVWLSERWETDATTGWRHELLGLLTFASAIGLLASTDRLLAFLAESVRSPLLEDVQEPIASDQAISPSVAPRQSPNRSVVAVATVGFALLALAELAWVWPDALGPSAAFDDRFELLRDKDCASHCGGRATFCSASTITKTTRWSQAPAWAIPSC